MDLANTAGIFRRADIARWSCLALGLYLGGCSQATHPPVLPPAPPRPIPMTGIASCDAYLNSYLACHRAAGIYGPDALQTHYQAMRASLLQDANDPRVRPYLAYRCAGLTDQLNAALKGRSCTTQSTNSNATPH
jgi:hypothetical protein